LKGSIGRRVVGCYAALLRAYPAHFRAEFGEEMRAVFADAIAEAQDDFVLAGLFLGELRDLPLSVVREHWRERQGRPLIVLPEGVMGRTYYSPRLFRFLAVTLLALVALYVVSAIAAYVVFDLHVNAWDRAWEWWYSYDDDPSYIGNVLPLGLAGYCFWMIGPAWAVLAGGLLAVMLWRQWPGLTRRMRWLGVSAVLAGTAMFVSMGSSIGYISVLWAFD
jgi:hypothetical protein